jgi:hypothetical protein
MLVAPGKTANRLVVENAKLREKVTRNAVMTAES